MDPGQCQVWILACSAFWQGGHAVYQIIAAPCMMCPFDRQKFFKPAIVPGNGSSVNKLEVVTRSRLTSLTRDLILFGAHTRACMHVRCRCWHDNSSSAIL